MRKVMQIFRIRKIGSLNNHVLINADILNCTGGNISGIFFSYRITDGAEGIK